jgi:hypothetical protein
MPPSDSSRAVSQVSPSIELGGDAYFDYSYVLSSEDAELEGANTFDYRRLYFTADYTLSEDFSGRFRLEAQGATTTQRGRPAPFVKDAWIRWDGPLAEGHRLTLGVQPSPLFEVSERVWGFRSLAKTILDRTRANDSRDFGLRADGPLVRGGALRYAAMVANGNSLRPEDEGQRGKHVYGELIGRPSAPIYSSLGVDYTSHEEGVDERDASTKLSAFVGTISDGFRGGVEVYQIWTDFEDPLVESSRSTGLSAFGAVTFGDDRQFSVVGRLDNVSSNMEEDHVYGLAAFVYRPIPAVEIMPNLIATKPDGADAEAEGRLTVNVRF